MTTTEKDLKVEKRAGDTHTHTTTTSMSAPPVHAVAPASPPTSDGGGDGDGDVDVDGEFADAVEGGDGQVISQAGDDDDTTDSKTLRNASQSEEDAPGSKQTSGRDGTAPDGEAKASDDGETKTKPAGGDTPPGGSTPPAAASPAAKKSSPGVAALMARFQQQSSSSSGSATGSGSAPTSPSLSRSTSQTQGLKAKSKDNAAGEEGQTQDSAAQSVDTASKSADTATGSVESAMKSTDTATGSVESAMKSTDTATRSVESATKSTDTSNASTTETENQTANSSIISEGIQPAAETKGASAADANVDSQETQPLEPSSTDPDHSTPPEQSSTNPDETIIAAAAINGESIQADYKIPPSQGAVSLLDPAATIENPFRSSTPRPEGDDTEDAHAIQPSTSRSSVAEPSSATSPWRESVNDLDGASVWQNEGANGGTLPQNLASELAMSPGAASTSSASNHFSVVSLSSSSAPGEASGFTRGGNARASNRDTMMAIGEAYKGGPPGGSSTTPGSKRISSQQFQERMRARVEGGAHKRNSSEGLDKLRENFEKIQQRQRQNTHSREPSGATIPTAATDHDADDLGTSAADAPADDGEGGDVDWDFWGRVMSNYHQVAQENPHELSAAIQAGIPAQLRGLCWQLLSASKDEEMEIIYAFYIRQSSPHEKQIRKDLSRTFPEQEYFKDGKGIGQENLFNVVKAYSLYDTECGYCQGMGFVCSVLLLNMPDEEAFSTLVRLMKSYGLRGHFLPNMPGLQLRLFQFDRLLEDMLPLLHRHLTRQGIKASMYATQWFMTLFSYRFPLDLVYRILDSVFAEGIEAIFRFAMALMQRSEEALLELSFEQALAHLKGSAIFDVYKAADAGSDSDAPRYSVDTFAQEAYAVQITPYMLDGYAAEFEEQVKAANAHRREVEALRLVNRNLASRVASLEEQLQQINAEHVDLVKEAVMSKIAKEEMEEELIRYKMLFAEASLRADQAGESTRTSRSVSSQDTTQSLSSSSNVRAGSGLSRKSDGPST